MLPCECRKQITETLCDLDPFAHDLISILRIHRDHKIKIGVLIQIP